MLNPQQSKVVNETNRPCCVVAIPGSGKTKTCIAKIAKLLSQEIEVEGSLLPKTVMAVTFTAQAAKELRERTAKAVPRDQIDRLTAGTFHSIFMKKLRSIGAEVTERRLARKGQVEQFRDRALLKCVNGWQAAKSEEAKDWYRTLFEQARSNVDTGQEVELDKSIHKAVEHYRRELKQQGMMDFGMILEETLKYLSAEEGEGTERTGKWRESQKEAGKGGGKKELRNEQRRFIGANHVMVDEAQDIDEVQLELVLAMHKLGVVVDIVGDDDQSIYRFRFGLGYEGMRRFAEATGARTLRLEENYRSKEEVLQLARQVIERNSPSRRVPKTLVGRRGVGGVVTLDEFPTGAAELDEMSNEVLNAGRKDKEAGRTRSRAVLGRTNKVLDEVEGMLREKKVPFERLGGGDVWSEGPVCFFLAALSGLTSKNPWDGADQCLYWAGANLAHIDMQTLEGDSQASKKDVKLAADLRHALSTARRYAWSIKPSDIRSAVATVYEWFYRAATAPWVKKPVADFYVGRLKIAVRVLAGDKGLDEAMTRTDDEERRDKVGQQEGGRVGLQGLLAKRLEAASQSNKTGKNDPEAVRIASMHGCKGLEWDQVWIVSCDDKTIPGGRIEETEDLEMALEEERRLMYVAMTRSRDELYVSWSPLPAHKSGKTACSESRLLMELSKRPGKRRSREQTASSFDLAV